MAMKKAIVATGNSEFFIEKGKTGYLVPPNKPSILAEMIEDLMNNPERRISFGEAAYEKVKQMCDLENYGTKLYDIYSNLLMKKN